MIWIIPGFTQPGKTCQRPVDFLSIYPTLCELSGVPLPNHLEGKSIATLLKRPGSHWDGVALTTHGYQNHAIRDGQFRYIRYADLSEELYDHTNDPYEFTNLANDPSMLATKHRLAAFLPKHETLPKKMLRKKDKGKR